MFGTHGVVNSFGTSIQFDRAVLKRILQLWHYLSGVSIPGLSKILFRSRRFSLQTVCAKTAVGIPTVYADAKTPNRVSSKPTAAIGRSRNSIQTLYSTRIIIWRASILTTELYGIGRDISTVSKQRFGQFIPFVYGHCQSVYQCVPLSCTTIIFRTKRIIILCRRYSENRKRIIIKNNPHAGSTIIITVLKQKKKKTQIFRLWNPFSS